MQTASGNNSFDLVIISLLTCALQGMEIIFNVALALLKVSVALAVETQCHWIVYLRTH